jgi:hypothetical protein
LIFALLRSCNVLQFSTSNIAGGLRLGGGESEVLSKAKMSDHPHPI